MTVLVGKRLVIFCQMPSLQIINCFIASSRLRNRVICALTLSIGVRMYTDLDRPNTGLCESKYPIVSSLNLTPPRESLWLLKICSSWSYYYPQDCCYPWRLCWPLLLVAKRSLEEFSWPIWVESAKTLLLPILSQVNIPLDDPITEPDLQIFRSESQCLL